MTKSLRVQKSCYSAPCSCLGTSFLLQRDGRCLRPGKVKESIGRNFADLQICCPQHYTSARKDKKLTGSVLQLYSKKNKQEKKKGREKRKEERKEEDKHKMKPYQKIEGKPENESEPKLEEDPKSEEKPEEEEKTEGTFREKLIQSLQEFKEDIHNRHLSKDDTVREVNELDEIRRVRNKLIVMRWKVNRNHPYPYLM
ncbi:transcription elongation factor A protein-like 9 isoform 2-T2 [Glossophaga mutica]